MLLEYENMEGLILSTEVTKKRVKSVNKFLKIGRQETMMVIRVDREKRYIDLSKKKVLPEEANKVEKYFKKAKMVHNIMKQTAIKLDTQLIKLYEAFGWDLYDKFEHAYDAFRLAMRYATYEKTHCFSNQYLIVILKPSLTRLKSQKSKRNNSWTVSPRKWRRNQSRSEQISN